MYWKKNGLRNALLAGIFLTALIVLALLRLPNENLYSQQFLYFGTVINVSLVTESPTKAEELFAAIEQELIRMHRDWHAWEPSLITQINAICGTTKSLVIPADLAELLLLGKKYYTLSDGLFNPAAAKLTGAWGFLDNDPSKPRAPPTAENIAALVKQHPSMDDILIENNTVRCTNSAVQLDVGGYAKGYAIDQLLQHLKNQGVTNALIDAGGDIGIRGQAIDRPWRIAIQNPITKAALKTLSLTGSMAVFTSGNAVRTFEYKNNRYTHIINPHSGKPVTGFIAITVLSEDATLDPAAASADAAATALMVAGTERWKEIAQRFGVKKVYAMTTEEVMEWPEK